MICEDTGVTLEGVVLEKGYYRFTSSSSDVRECTFELNCVHTNETGGSICIKGAAGPLCQECEDLYYLRDSTAKCESCTESSEWYADTTNATINRTTNYITNHASHIDLITQTKNR